MKPIKIALVGQPNVGKSFLINAIGDTKLRVGNFSGVTVAKKTIEFSRNSANFEVTDLPGSYSLTDYTIEEGVTKDFIDDGDYDLIVNVIDSTNIERNLYLTMELLALNKKVVVALNMDDEAINEGVAINEKQLSKLLGIRCIKTSALEKTGIDALIKAIIQTHNEPLVASRLLYSDPYEEEISKITTFLAEKKYKSDSNLKSIAIKLLREDKNTYLSLRDEPIWTELQPLLNKSYQHLYLHYASKDLDSIFHDEKNALAKGAVIESVKFDHTKVVGLTDKIDAVLTNRFVGLPIFLFLMWGLFQITFELGSIPMDWIDAFFGMLIDGTKSFLGDTELASVIADGAIAGVGAVVLFLPNIIILFTGIALLESTGYMSRAAFLLDGFFHKFGLHGKSFVPLVSGFGCSVPAYMAARVLKNDRDRLLTLYIIGFMSCGAKLPVYVLIIGAFVAQEHAGNMLFAIYILGALLGVFAAKILKLTVFKGDDEPFVMEMPKYRLPTLKLLYHTVSEKAFMYLKKAGTYILLASILVWFASNYPKYPDVEAQYAIKIEQVSKDDVKVAALTNELSLYNLENSYLGKIGHATEPFFAPLGFDWRMAVALETGLAAKEIVVATMGVLYGLGNEQDEESDTLIDKLKANITLPAAIAFTIFVMIYFPCLAASMVFRREAGSWKHWGYLFIFTTGTAWVLAFIAFNIASAIF
ncbi:MAG: ferrous iron transport protein B [Cocleimonas sp.]|nr:ferrous iron transport protein B [Cocleimonas sp.]